MRIKLTPLAAAVGALLITDLPALPQLPAMNSFRVEVHAEPSLGREDSAQLTDMGHQRIATGSRVSDDSFEFRDVAPGQYWFALVDSLGATIYQEMMNVGNSSWVSINLPKAKRPAQPPSGPVSVTQLQHKPSRQAVQAFHQAQKLAARHETAKSAEQYEKAIRLSPGFAEAYTNLAAEHLIENRFEDAIGEASHAMEITGPDPFDLTNIAYAQFYLKRYDAAAQSARAALELKPEMPPAHYILGLVLAGNRRTFPEALPHLELAAQSIPSARANLELIRQRFGPGH